MNRRRVPRGARCNGRDGVRSVAIRRAHRIVWHHSKERLPLLAILRGPSSGRLLRDDWRRSRFRGKACALRLFHNRGFNQRCRLSSGALAGIAVLLFFFFILLKHICHGGAASKASEPKPTAFKRHHFWCAFRTAMVVVHARASEAAHSGCAVKLLLHVATGSLRRLPLRVSRQGRIERTKSRIKVNHLVRHILIRDRDRLGECPRLEISCIRGFGDGEGRNVDLRIGRVLLESIDFLQEPRWRRGWRSPLLLSVAMFGLARKNRSSPCFDLLLLLAPLLGEWLHGVQNHVRFKSHVVHKLFRRNALRSWRVNVRTGGEGAL